MQLRNSHPGNLLDGLSMPEGSLACIPLFVSTAGLDDAHVAQGHRPAATTQPREPPTNWGGRTTASPEHRPAEPPAHCQPLCPCRTNKQSAPLAAAPLPRASRWRPRVLPEKGNGKAVLRGHRSEAGSRRKGPRRRRRCHWRSGQLRHNRRFAHCKEQHRE